MLQFYTEDELFPDDCQLLGHPRLLFDTVLAHNKELLLSEPVAEALREIEDSRIDTTSCLPINHLGEYFAWSDLGSGLKSLITQYYLCHGGIDDLGSPATIKAKYCGSNIMSFMFLHEDWFDAVPIYLDCYNFAINPHTEPLSGLKCGYEYNAEFYAYFQQVKCEINNYVLEYDEAVDLMLCMKGGYYKSWQSRVKHKPELRYFDKYLDEESRFLIYDWLPVPLREDDEDARD